MHSYKPLAQVFNEVCHVISFFIVHHAINAFDLDHWKDMQGINFLIRLKYLPPPFLYPYNGYIFC